MRNLYAIMLHAGDDDMLLWEQLFTSFEAAKEHAEEDHKTIAEEVTDNEDAYKYYPLRWEIAEEGSCKRIHRAWGLESSADFIAVGSSRELGDLNNYPTAYVIAKMVLYE